MNFRTTAFSISKQALEFAAQYNSNIYQYQRQIASGHRIHRPSDDPIAFRQISSLNARLNELNVEKNNISVANRKLNMGVSQLTEAHQILARAKVIAQQSVQAASDAELNAFAMEIEGMLNSLKEIAKSEVDGDYLFSGTNSNIPPFQFSDPTVIGGPLAVQYHGSNDHSRTMISDVVSIDMLHAGNKVFGGLSRGQTVIRGNTGAAIGSGTDTVIGRAILQVRHTATTYAAGSGVTTGASSPGGDTVIGNLGVHSLTINDTSGTGASGTVSLNGGNAISFASTDTDLEVVGPNGEKVYLDMSNITAGFNGTVDLSASGTFSIDGGLSTTAIDFSSNQTIFDSTSGRFVNIDSQAVHRTGDDHLEFPGTSNAFQALYDLAETLKNDRGLSAKELAEAINTQMGEIDGLADHVLTFVGSMSTSLSTLERLESRNLDLELETETRLSFLQATDIPDAVLKLQSEQSLLQYTYAITAEINSIGLIDFLR